jgi:hypothetical protein
MQIEQKTIVTFEGDKNCDHAFMTDGAGNLTLKPLIKSLFGGAQENHELHSVDRICIKCMRFETVQTLIDWSTPFTFAAVMAKLKAKQNQ